MRQLLVLLLCVGALAIAAESSSESPEATANKRLELAKEQVDRIANLVESGALPRVRLEQAQLDVADAQDDVILSKALYAEIPVGELTDKFIDEMVAAAQRRVERQQQRVDQANKLVADGVAPQSYITPFEDELAMRRVNLQLAHTRAHVMGELASLAKFEKTAQEIQIVTRIDYHDTFAKGMEHFEGGANFEESRDLKPLELAFTKKFDRALPISADGETNLHRALGFDHAGRVDVAINPSDSEGVWLRHYLRVRGIPYYAFTRAIRGKATSAHIHIGPGSTRLHNAD
jgi:hypothetical protein